ncbi:DEAD/DEAH box helicase [Propioniciclava sinopodophylli]|uniref:DEAD/DEAH box helicase n=1 Tax=Propioniciclava sinopodophylli TaxID=1837344 RepID=UPI002491F215|nr:DEAD/DEAH box helicase family protein [Propioniciclava sinopodophylli]
MGDLSVDQELLEEVAERLDLRETNRRAVETVLLRTSLHYDIDGNSDLFECIVDSATGVGKTYVLAGLIEYLALADPPARNFLVMAPGRTIRNKTIRNFTPGDKKSLTAGMRSVPYLITADNFDSPATRAIMEDPTRTKVYVFTVQALTSATGEGRATHEFQEGLGTSFYEWLSRQDDLVIFADEHHCYRGPAFSRTIRELNPELVVGLTATPEKADEKLVVYRYPLAAAIADQLVKTPVVVGRRDDRNDPETKLLDGVSLLRKKERVLSRHCEENGLDLINPVMLVVARNIEEAHEFRDVLDSVGFDGGAWVNRTLLVHSKLTGDAKEQALADLDAVEEPDSPVRIIINVGMLKEGWDVKNVYVIASMRASVSDVLTEQTLGRGLRLPFGTYTGTEFLDTLEVLAHERYEALLEKRNVLNQNFVDYYTYAETRTRPDGTVTVTTKVEEVTADVLPGLDTPAAVPTSQTPTGTPAAPATQSSGRPASIIDTDTRQAQADDQAQDEAQLREYLPLVGREAILIPKVKSVPVPVHVSLNDIDTDEYSRFDRLGKSLTTELSTDLRRTKIVAKRLTDRNVKVGVEAAADEISATFVMDVPLETSRQILLEHVMAVKGVAQRPAEIGAAQRIVARVIDAMGEDAAPGLSAFMERCAQRLQADVSAALRDANTGQVSYEDTVELVALEKMRFARKRQLDGHPDGGFDRNVAFNGWQRNLYSHAWFDTKPEYRAANAIDAANSVVVWARLHRNDIPITWTAEGRQYNPDLVVLEEIEGRLHGWLVETKADKDITSDEVVGKRRGARRWTNVVNASPEVKNIEWHYLLLAERDVNDAQGSWEQMKGFGR